MLKYSISRPVYRYDGELLTKKQIDRLIKVQEPTQPEYENRLDKSTILNLALDAIKWCIDNLPF